MKRIQQKVKDLIEVRPYKSLQDFNSEPAQTLEIYHFTDFTSDLMAKYIDKIAAAGNLRQGAALALAGYRGVGKSHFLAAFGALVSHPELRSKIEDTHIVAGIQRLKRARYPVAYVRRGTHETLFAELKAAVARCFEANAANLPDSLTELLTFASEKAGELPFVLIVDTAFERVSRVERDDGILLGEIAERAKQLDIFVVVALDDDIADADGINAAIARNFTIDYLDQEHLYRIVDAHLFPKNRQMQPTLHEIYTDFRECLPGFRWSEQRFAALYPLHPIILEIAPFVRLYAPEFALLGFAAEAAAKIMARPANSLIALDEVFDQVESSLRKSEELNEVFNAYDYINKNYIAQISIMQRLQAKLVLKALFLLSLEGNGTTAGETAASVLIYDENEQDKSVQSVVNLLEGFAATIPSAIERTTEAGRDTRYNFAIGKRNNLGKALSEAIKTISAAAIPKILRRAAGERFAELMPPDGAARQDTDVIDCTAEWRGSLRRGQVIWALDNHRTIDEKSSFDSDREILDWELIITDNHNDFAAVDSPETSKIFWQPAPLKIEETEAILRYYVLLTDKNLRAEYGEQLRAAGHAYVSAVEKIWNRIFLEDAKIIAENFDFQATPETRNAADFNKVICALLEPFFEKQYPEHPYFTETFGEREVSALVGDFFGGARQNLTETQHLAEAFALPLGLVALNGNFYTTETAEHFANLSLTAQILVLVRENPEQTITLKEIYRTLKKQPYGLVNEAQHLILTALVAQRQIEFVTTSGDRINRRSLDLKIIWNDIEGVAKPSSVVYSDERLTEWARILTDSKNFDSITPGADREAVYAALEKWFADWKSAATLTRFDNLADEILNTAIWRLALRVEKTFRGVASTLDGILANKLVLEEGLHRIADAFNDSERDFRAAVRDLIVLRAFIDGAAIRETIKSYLIVCENTGDERIELKREKLVALTEQSYLNPNETLNRETENFWETFHAEYAEFFAAKHDTAMKSKELRANFDEILKSDDYWEFENLSRLEIFENTFRREAADINRRFKELDCRFDAREMLKIHPFCGCSFSLENSRELENLPSKLKNVIQRGRSYYLKTLRLNRQPLIFLIEKFAETHNRENFAETALSLTRLLENEDESKILDNNELTVLRRVAKRLPTASQTF